MNIKNKRFVSILLVILMVVAVASVGLLSVKSASVPDPSIVLLESMLNGDRHWVLDTIVDDDRSKNPYANAYSSTKTSLMATALSQIENPDDPNYRKSYTILVDFLTRFYYENTWDDDITAGILDLVDEILELFGDGENAFGSFLDDLKKTTEEEKFEAILQSVFTDTYTASWGESVNQQETSLLQLSEIASSLDNYKALTDYWSALYGVALDEESETIIDYQDNVINPLISSGQKYLSAFSSMSEGEQAAASVAITSASALAMWNWHTSYSTTYSGVPTLTQDLLDRVAGEDAAHFVKTVGNTFSFASGAINQFTYLHAMCQQQSTFHDTMLRIAAQAGSDGQYRMRDVLEDYAEQMNDVLDYNKLNYHIFVTQLGKTSTIQKNLKYSKALEAAMPDAWKKAFSSCDLASMTKAFDVGMFGVDLATNLKESCIKISEMKYLRKMINEAKMVYEADLLNYTGEPTADNAQKVLNDLIFLQRLRLRGENLAYKMVKGQINSGIAKLVSGGNAALSADWTKHYQRSIDCLIGATINPISYTPFEVKYGDQLVIYYDENTGAYCGGYSDGTVLYEMQYRIMNGIKLSGGTLSVMEIAIPFINVTNGGTLSIDASTATIAELTQSGRMTLNVYQDDLEFQTCLDLSNAIVNLNGNTISTPDLTLSNSVSFQDGLVQTEALHLKSATITGCTIQCSGDMDASGSSTLTSLAMVGGDPQKITGSFTTGELLLQKTGSHRIESGNSITVTGILSDPKDVVSGGIILTETAKISGNSIASDLTLNKTTISAPVQYKRSVKVINGAQMCGGRIQGSLTVNSGTFSNLGSMLKIDNGIVSTGGTFHADAPVSGYSDAYFSNTCFSGSGGLDLHGEVSFTSGNTASADSVINLYGNCTSNSSKNTNQLSTLNLCGTSAQTIQFTGTVENLILSNRSAFGVEMTGSTYVTGLLTARNQRISLGNNIILTGEAAVELGNVSGNLQIQDWHGTGLNGLNGTLYAYGNNTITNNIDLGGGIRQVSGTMTLNGAAVNCREIVEASGAWILDENSSLIMKSDSALSGSIENKGWIVANNLTLSGNISGSGTLQVNGNLTNSKGNIIENLRISGNSGQHISGSSLTVKHMVLENNSLSGTTFDVAVSVTDSLTAQDQKIHSGDRLILTGTAFADLENVSGNLRIENWNGSSLPALKGTLYASGDNTISSDVTLRGGIRQTGGTILVTSGTVTCQEGLECAGSWTIAEGGTLSTSGDGVFQGNVVNNGRMYLSDLTLSGSLSGNGTLELAGNLQTSKANTFGTLVLSGDTPQTVGGSSITVTDLTLANTSARGITFNAQVYVTGVYSGTTTIYGLPPVQLVEQSVFDSDVTVASLSPSDDLLIRENVTVTVKGDVTANKAVVLEKGAKLIVYGSFVGSGGSVQIGEGSHIDVRRDLRLTSKAVTINGKLLVHQDTLLSGGSISGTGTLELKGDLQNSGTVSGLNRLILSGRAPQHLTGSDIHVACVAVDNRTYSGVTLGLTIYYSEECSISDGSVVNTERIKEE